MATFDAGGNLKMWDISRISLDDYTAENLVEIYFTNIHTGPVNCIDIFKPDEHNDMFFTTCGNDKYVRLYKIDGSYVGHFGSGNRWVLGSVENTNETMKPAVKPPAYVKDRRKRNADNENPEQEE